MRKRSRRGIASRKATSLGCATRLGRFAFPEFWWALSPRPSLWCGTESPFPSRLELPITAGEFPLLTCGPRNPCPLAETVNLAKTSVLPVPSRPLRPARLPHARFSLDHGRHRPLSRGLGRGARELSSAWWGDAERRFESEVGVPSFSRKCKPTRDRYGWKKPPSARTPACLR